MVPSCAEGGVLGGHMRDYWHDSGYWDQSNHLGSEIPGRLMLYNALEMKFRELKCPNPVHDGEV